MYFIGIARLLPLLTFGLVTVDVIELKRLLLVDHVAVPEILLESDVLFNWYVLLREHGKLYYTA